MFSTSNFGSLSSLSTSGSSSSLSSFVSLSSSHMSASTEGGDQEKKESKEEKNIRQKEASTNDPDSTENAWLLDVIDTDSKDRIEAALKKGANVDVMTNEGTPLYRAVRAKKSKSALALLERKADINLVSRDFSTPIELAASTGQFDLLLALLAKRQVFQKKRFDAYVKYCVDHYITRTEENFKKQNHAMIAHYVSRFVGCHVGRLLSSNHNDERYVVHLYAFKTALHNTVRLEGWQAQEFLPLRIYTFFEILVKLKKGLITPKDGSSAEYKFAQTQIEREILMARETLRTVQDRLAIKKFNDVASEEEGKSDQQSSSQKTTAEEKGTNEKTDELYRTLAKRIIQDVADLKEGGSYPLSIGFQDHEIYLTFMHHQDHILIRIDNLGHGHSKHGQKKEQDATYIQPFKLHSVLRSTIKQNEQRKSESSSPS